MKKFYTSNYARHANNPLSVGISYTIPVWYNGKTRTKLAPTIGMVLKHKGFDGGRSTNEEYIKAYIKLLEEREVDCDYLIDTLPDGTIFLCYESPGEFCHRRIFAEWIEAKTGMVIPEWMNEK